MAVEVCFNILQLGRWMFVEINVKINECKRYARVVHGSKIVERITNISWLILQGIEHIVSLLENVITNITSQNNSNI